MTRTKKIICGRHSVSVLWRPFTKGDPETCDESTQGVTFPPSSRQGFLIIINTLYSATEQRATMLHELWHVAEFEMGINRYCHKSMDMIMDKIWLMIRQHKWLRDYIWN